jgi:hypothetical protein
MQGGSLSPSYTRILALHSYSLFFPTLTSRIVYLSSSNSGPGLKGVCLGQTPLGCSAARVEALGPIRSAARVL